MTAMQIGQGDKVLGIVTWSDGQYEVRGMAIPTKELARAIPSIEHYSGLSGEELVQALPEYFAGTDKWAKPA